MCTQFPDLLDEATSVAAMLARAMRARRHAECLAPDPVTDALLAYARELETRAERIMEAAIPAKFHPAA